MPNAAYILVSILWDDYEVHAAYAKREDADKARDEADAAQKRKQYKRAYLVEEVEFYA